MLTAMLPLPSTAACAVLAVTVTVFGQRDRLGVRSRTGRVGRDREHRAASVTAAVSRSGDTVLVAGGKVPCRRVPVAT